MGLGAVSWQQWRDAAQLVDVDGIEVAAYDLGSPTGPVLTFLHGFPSSSLDIAPVLPHLQDRWRVVAVDLPGFGASSKPPDRSYSIHAAVDAVEAIWHELGIETTVVAAHDYSVSVGQELLARRSAPVAAMVLMNGGLYPDLHRPTAGQVALLDPDHGAEIAAAITQETFVAGTARTWGTRVPFDEHAVREMFHSMDERGGVAMMHTLLHYIAEALERAEVPLSFVWGDLDPVSGAHMIERVEQRCPEANIVRMADVGHWPTLEAPEVVAAEIDRYERFSSNQSRNTDR
jgi:pimeloyl-ACP methyl ester carboxylesterase